MTHKAYSRREVLRVAGATAAATLASAALPRVLCAAEPAKTKPALGKARHCIFIWLAGGACHIVTWDPKRRGDAKKKVAGSYYDSVPTAIRDVRVCRHLRRTADLMDRGVILRGVHHDVVDEHAAATNRLHTGRPTSGTIVYPSIGSITAQQLGPGGKSAPAYVVMGYPNASRGPGFLGAKHSYIYLTETTAGPTGLSRPAEITQKRQDRRDRLLAQLRREYLRRNRGDRAIENYAAVAREAQRLAGPEAMATFDLTREPAALRERYGSEFGQRLLLARRLVQAGTRFVEVTSNLNFKNGTGWDTHNDGQLKQHLLIDALDEGLSALIADLDKRKLLDTTLVVVATEFGRPPEFDAGGGRGHHSKAFSIALFGGGLKTGQAIGTTDELGRKIVNRPVSVPDLHATMYSALGINPAKELYTDDARPVPITDHGKAIGELFG